MCEFKFIYFTFSVLSLRKLPWDLIKKLWKLLCHLPIVSSRYAAFWISTQDLFYFFLPCVFACLYQYSSVEWSCHKRWRDLRWKKTKHVCLLMRNRILPRAVTMLCTLLLQSNTEMSCLLSVQYWESFSFDFFELKSD